MVASTQFTVPSLGFGGKVIFPEFRTLHNGRELIWEVSTVGTNGLQMALKGPEKVEIEITKGYLSNTNGNVLGRLEGMKFETGKAVDLCVFWGSQRTFQIRILGVRQLVSFNRKLEVIRPWSKLLEKVMRGDPDPDFDGNFRLVSADGATFYVHKAILAGMEYFERNFENKTKDVIEGKIEFKDVHSSTLRRILSLAYTGEYEKVKEYDFEEIKGLFHAFDKFMFKKESDELQKEVGKFLSPENVGEILVMSDVYKLAYLKAEALKMAKKNVKFLLGSIWEDICVRNDLVKEILEGFAT